MVDLNTQRGVLRRSVGHGEDTALVSDDLLNDALAAALRRVNAAFPLIGIGSFVTVADQQKYTPLPADGSTLRKVYWPPRCAYSFPQPFSRYIDMLAVTEPTGVLDTRRLVEPSVVIGLQQQREFFNRTFGEGGNILNGVDVYLDPIPTDAQTVYFEYNAIRFAQESNVDDEHLNAYYCAARQYIHEALAAGRGGLTSVSSTGGVSMSTRASQHHLELAQRCKEEFVRYLPMITPLRKW